MRAARQYPSVAALAWRAGHDGPAPGFEIAESRPMSKTKSWVVTRLVKKAGLA